MATIKQFEDLICWQRARELAKFIYDISKYRNGDISKYGNFSSDKGLVDQIRRAAVSVMSNVAEGFDRGTRQEFINYLFIAKGSAGEVKSQLYIAFDAQYIDISKFQYGIRLADECSRLIQSFINKLKSGGQTGLQYKREKSKSEREQEEFTKVLADFVEEKKRNPDAKFDDFFKD